MCWGSCVFILANEPCGLQSDLDSDTVTLLLLLLMLLLLLLLLLLVVVEWLSLS